jgi:Fic family protein
MNDPQYLYWDKIKYKPRPEYLTAEETWALVKFSRQWAPGRVTSPIETPEKKKFTWQTIPWMQQLMHEVDLNLGGELSLATNLDSAAKRRIISRGIIEEAIASSQLEGAATTRRVAKQMILERRKPRNHSERMILNNYNAMVAIEDRFKGAEMNVDALLEMHAILTKDILDADRVGILRRESDDIAAVDALTGTVFHQPPLFKYVKEQLAHFMDYANDKKSQHAFEHPLTKAVTLHFWIGYLHPFVDGNGRLARALFYWYMLRKKYWAFAYLPISRAIKSSPGQYRNAYAYSEQDDFDLTYFIDYNLRKVCQARDGFVKYLERKHDEASEMSAIARGRYKLNDRQIQLLKYFHKNARATTTISTHAHISKVSS